MKKLLSAYIRVRTYTTAFLFGIGLGLTLYPLDLKADTTVRHDANTPVMQDTTVRHDIYSWIISVFGW